MGVHEVSHRLVGNFPQRGYGKALLSADFPTGYHYVSEDDFRIPSSGVPYVKPVSELGTVVVQYETFELQALSYGLLAALCSRSCGVKGARNSYYTDAAVPMAATGGKPVYTLQELGIKAEDLLWFDGFIPVDTFWNLPKNAASVDKSEWRKAPAGAAGWQIPAVLSKPENLRSLLANYWHAASIQFFGPWEEKERDRLKSVEDPILTYYCKPRNLTVCLGDDTDCDEIIRKGKLFFARVILDNLPPQVQNIASVSLAVPANTATSVYRDSAMSVVYPRHDGTDGYDLRTGNVPGISAEEDDFIREATAGKMPALLTGLKEAWNKRFAGNPEACCTLDADYELCYFLYRIEHNHHDAAMLLKDWYAVNKLLSVRHGAKAASPMAEEDLNAVTEAMDCELALRVKEAAKEIKAVFQPDGATAEEQKVLFTFLWRKALLCADSVSLVLSGVVENVQDREASPDLLTVIGENGTEDERAQIRAAGLVKKILTGDTGTPIDHDHARVTGLKTQGLIDAACASEPLRAELGNWIRAMVKTDPEILPGIVTPAAAMLGDNATLKSIVSLWSAHLKENSAIPDEDERTDFGIVWNRCEPDEELKRSLSAWLADIVLRGEDGGREVFRAVAGDGKQADVFSEVTAGAIHAVLKSNAETGEPLTLNQAVLLVADPKVVKDNLGGLCSYCPDRLPELKGDFDAYDQSAMERSYDTDREGGASDALLNTLRINGKIGESLGLMAALDGEAKTPGDYACRWMEEQMKDRLTLPEQTLLDTMDAKVLIRRRDAVEAAYTTVMDDAVSNKNEDKLVDALDNLKELEGRLAGQESHAGHKTAETTFAWIEKHGAPGDKLFDRFHAAMESPAVFGQNEARILEVWNTLADEGQLDASATVQALTLMRNPALRFGTIDPETRPVMNALMARNYADRLKGEWQGSGYWQGLAKFVPGMREHGVSLGTLYRKIGADRVGSKAEQELDNLSAPEDFENRLDVRRKAGEHIRERRAAGEDSFGGTYDSKLKAFFAKRLPGMYAKCETLQQMDELKETAKKEAFWDAVRASMEVKCMNAAETLRRNLYDGETVIAFPECCRILSDVRYDRTLRTALKKDLSSRLKAASWNYEHRVGIGLVVLISPTEKEKGWGAFISYMMNGKPDMPDKPLDDENLNVLARINGAVGQIMMNPVFEEFRGDFIAFMNTNPKMAGYKSAILEAPVKQRKKYFPQLNQALKSWLGEF